MYYGNGETFNGMRKLQKMLNGKLLNPYDKNWKRKQQTGEYLNFLEDFMDYIPNLYVEYDLFKKIIQFEYIPKYIKNHHIKFFKENKKTFEKMTHSKINNPNFGGDFYEIDL